MDMRTSYIHGLPWCTALVVLWHGQKWQLTGACYLPWQITVLPRVLSINYLKYG
jgi:hypothetical protein